MPFCEITVGARSSALSKTQVEEVFQEVKKYHSHIEFVKTFSHTIGDNDQKTSLRTLGKTDFFTREIDLLLLNHEIRVGIHSAKDLPDPLPEGVMIVAVTEGVDSSDSLVLREGETLETISSGSIIATSSERREEAVRELRKDLTFVDIRGDIGMRLAQLDSGKVDGVVIAEAALIRLGFVDRNRITLPGETTKGQGQLAITARLGDVEMEELFACLDSRKSVSCV